MLVKPLKYFGIEQPVWKTVVICYSLAALFVTPQAVIFTQTEEPLNSTHDATKLKCESAGYSADRVAAQALHLIPHRIYDVNTWRSDDVLLLLGYISQVMCQRATARGATATPRVRFIRSQTASDAAAVVQSEQTPDLPVMPRCRSMPLDLQCSHPALVVPREMAVQTNHNAIKISMSVTVGFMTCLTPYFVISLICIYSDYHYTLTTALGLSELLVLAHSAFNPILYIIFSARDVRVTLIQLCQRAVPLCC